jgi:hypothetical protein
MARKKDPLNSEEVRWLVRCMSLVASFFDRFGIALTVLLLLLLTVKWMGSAKTQDDFVRELLFGQITGGRSLAIFFAVLIAISILGIDTIVRARLTESAEMKRVTAEKTKWQERALQSELSHTDEVQS